MQGGWPGRGKAEERWEEGWWGQLPPPSSWAGALASQDSMMEQGALQPLAGGPGCND